MTNDKEGRQIKSTCSTVNCLAAWTTYMPSIRADEEITTTDVYTTHPRKRRKFAIIHQMAPKKKWIKKKTFLHTTSEWVDRSIMWHNQKLDFVILSSSWVFFSSHFSHLVNVRPRGENSKIKWWSWAIGQCCAKGFPFLTWSHILSFSLTTFKTSKHSPDLLSQTSIDFSDWDSTKPYALERWSSHVIYPLIR